MNNQIHEKWFCDETWQRVVDDELEAAELRELVAVCNQRPELWKRCAVAFLEEQTLRSELQQLGTQWLPTPSASLPALAAIDDVHSSRDPANHEPQLAAKREHSFRKAPAHAAGVSQSSVLNSLALAASVMLAFAVGWQASRRLGGQSQRAAAADPVSSLANTNSNPPSMRTIPSKPSASERFSAEAYTGNDNQFVDLPASTSSTADAIHRALQRPDQFVPIDRAIPKELVELQRRGLVHIESTEGIMTVQLQDGKTAVVPVQQFDVQSIGNAY